ncbi:MAG: C4-dicarboxylate ABC transporter [Alphaproteobacteria bacterium]|nr:C4-dicarboxylate ABC transporter [Alphaproteobacteria bacterium]MBU0803942.1 C4-dicarboxylate ABC transporter [Alphaproteobacteria bacterium]MBU0872761.1 C4-dicarboxylate ABC transporter [Alphaproteobacteria bacterium]MBU1402869.1 C4-dicarboxylate ABC transporter [Alphaproteobacteria bacterium]MBU1593511.1 C4-dicarboxylate ABC transporter [Alphaproteobacteria bacterium]
MTKDNKTQSPSEKILASRRTFLRNAGFGGAALAGSTLAAPAIVRAQAPIKWRLQSYSGAPLGAHVIKPQIDAFNAAANGEMEIELYYADQLVPTAELFRAMQNGTIDAVQSDDATMASPVDISVFGGYFPFATRYSLDVPSLFNYYGLNEIWAEAYGEVENVTWLSSGAWDPLHIFTVNKPIRSLADMNGLRVFGVPTAGKFLSKYGLIPVTVPWDDVEVAMQTGELDGVAWCGFTEAYEVGWADVCNYALTNSVTGAWFGSYFANTESWNKVPPHLQQLYRSTVDQSHYYRDVWYWGGEAKLRVEGEKMELTSIPAEEWGKVVDDSEAFWDEIASASPRSAKVVQAFKDYAGVMKKAGYPYR